MPADIESFASLREPAWHGLGTVFDEEVTTAEMLDKAGLANWNVRLEPVSVPGVDADRHALPCFATVRDNPFDGKPDALGFVGGRYKVLQLENLFDFGDELLSGGGRWETAGSLKGGRVAFGSLAVERETVLDPSGVADTVKQFLLLATSFDGSTAVTAANTPVRVVCANTLNMALGGAKQSFKIRHTQTLDGKLAAAREALAMADVYMTEFDHAAQLLFQEKVNAKQTEDLIQAVFPRPGKDDSKASHTRWDNKRVAIDEILQGPTSLGVKDTAWGVFNAMTENLDWNRGVRNGNPEPKLAAAAGFDPVANAERNRIYKIVEEFATSA